MDDEFSRAIDEFAKKVKAKDMIIQGFKELCPNNKGNRFSLLITGIVALVFAGFLACSENTVVLLREFADKILVTQLAMFAAILTIFAIVFAFFDNEKIRIFARYIDKDMDETFLSSMALFYPGVMFLYLIDIALSGILLFALHLKRKRGFDKEWRE